MAICTVSDVNVAARARLGDENAGLFTDAILLPSVKTAYREFCRLLRNLGSPQIRSVVYYDLQPNVSCIDFVREPNIGLPDILFIDRIDWRSLSASNRIPISAIAVTSPTTGQITLTTGSAHGRSVGDRIMLALSKPVNNVRWTNGLFNVIGVGDSTHITTGLFHITAADASAYTANSAYVSYSGDDFKPLGEAQILSPLVGSPMLTKYYSLQNNQLTLQPDSNWRQLRLSVLRSGDTLTGNSDEILFDDALDFLAARAGAIAAEAKGAPNKYAALMAEAYGQGGDISNPVGGLAMQILNTAIKQLNTRARLRPRYRQIKSPGGTTVLWYTGQ